jgi:hypothetical protein
MAKTKSPTVEPDSAPSDEANVPASNGSTIRNSILAALGRPPELFDVAVRTLWDNHYRVNVLVGAEVTAVRIAHSYFVKTTASGEMVSATPRIIRLYESM